MKLNDPSTPIVLAKDTERGLVKLGGLGVLGVGQMWVKAEPRHEKYPHYKDAPIQLCPPDERP